MSTERAEYDLTVSDRDGDRIVIEPSNDLSAGSLFIATRDVTDFSGGVWITDADRRAIAAFLLEGLTS